MVQRVSTVSFEGIEVRPVDVQVQVAAGLPAFTIVGLPDKTVSEARERVRSALIASGLALPRVVAAMLETHQNEDGTITLPAAVRPYLGGIETIGAPL